MSVKTKSTDITRFIWNHSSCDGVRFRAISLLGVDISRFFQVSQRKFFSRGDCFNKVKSFSGLEQMRSLRGVDISRIAWRFQVLTGDWQILSQGLLVGERGICWLTGQAEEIGVHTVPWMFVSARMSFQCKAGEVSSDQVADVH